MINVRKGGKIFLRQKRYLNNCLFEVLSLNSNFMFHIDNTTLHFFFIFSIIADFLISRKNMIELSLKAQFVFFADSGQF